KYKRNMDNTISKVKEFMERFGQNVPDTIKVPPPETINLRLRLNLEELTELAIACGQTYVTTYIELLKNEINNLKNKIDSIPEKTDITEVFDAMIDKRYIADGDILSFGLHNYFSEGFEEVHGSNMSKLDENGKPIYREDGKVIKGPNYYRPNLKKILDK